MESLDLNASAKSEITVSRSSSLIANLSGYDDEETDTKDLFIIVDDPEKHSGSLESYVTFRVTTKVKLQANSQLPAIVSEAVKINASTTRCEFDTGEYEVRRRYNDFLWLRQKLEYTYPTHLVPPLPEKHRLRQLDRFSQDFLRVRQMALNKFLSRLADHPVLSFDKHFQVFLVAKAWEFQAHKKESAGLLGRVSDSLHNLGTSYMMKNRTPEFTSVHEYVQTFGEKMAAIDRITQRVEKEQSEHLADLLEWGPIYTLWSNSEDSLVNALQSMSKAIERSCNALKELVDSSEDNFSQPIKEYMLYAEAIKVVLRRRDAIQSEYDSTLEELNKKKDEREQLKISDQTYSLGAFLGKDPDDVKAAKQDKLETQVADLTKQMEVLNDKTVCSDSDLRADMERWHKNKHKDMREIFMALCDRNIKYYEQSLHSWEDTIRSIQDKPRPQEPVTMETNNSSDDKDSSSLLHTESTETEKTESDLN